MFVRLIFQVTIQYVEDKMVSIIKQVFYNTRYFGHLETARHHHHDKDPEAVNEEVNRKMSNV